MLFFADVMALRLQATGGGLTTLQEKSGFLGDLSARTFAPLGEGRAPNYPTAWLPTERVARAWQAMVTPSPDSTSTSRN